MQIKYYGSKYPDDTPGYIIQAVQESDNEWVYRNRIMIPEKQLIGILPTIDWRFRWHDGDEEYWQAYIADSNRPIALLHRGTYSIDYKTLNEGDPWMQSAQVFMYYAFVRIMEALLITHFARL